MDKILLLLGMLFLHIVDDYYLQGILASMKQKTWWESNSPGELYKYDYVVALIEHAFSWSFMIMLIPAIYIYQTNHSIIGYLILFIINWVIHTLVDNAKANEHKINLIQDQIIHVLQVIATWIIVFI